MNLNQMIKDSLQTIELEKITITLLEPGLIENHVKPGAYIEPKDVLELKEVNSKLAGQKPYTVLVLSGHLSSSSKEARELVASKEFAGLAIAKGLVVDSLGHRIVGNFYITVNKPHIRTKIFSDRFEAITWLKQQLKQS